MKLIKWRQTAKQKAIASYLSSVNNSLKMFNERNNERIFLFNSGEEMEVTFCSNGLFASNSKRCKQKQ